MKKLNLFVLAVLIVHYSYSQTTIVSDGFENTSTVFTITGSGNSFVSGTAASPALPTNSAYASQGTYGLAVTNGTATLTSGAINTSNYGGIQISFRVAAFSLAAGNGLDQVDRVRVGVSTDGGSFFSDIVLVTGATTNNSYWDYTGTGTASEAYPTQTVFNASSSGLNANGYSTITATNIPAQSNLIIRIVLNDGFNERWVIDDFKLTASIVLPLKLLSFTGELHNDHGLLEWMIATPEEDSKYEIQRSSDGNNFTTINILSGDAVKTKFNYTDVSPGSGINYYRLKMTDRVGKTIYSHIIKLSITGDAKPTVYPNRVKDKTTLHINDQRLIDTRVKLLNSKGGIVQTYIIRNNFEILDMSKLPSGLYILQLVNNTVFKLIKE